LKTIYDVKGAKDEEIMPSSATDVEAEPAPGLRHPWISAHRPPPSGACRRIASAASITAICLEDQLPTIQRSNDPRRAVRTTG
jgi:hypothetical protein